MPYKSGLTLLMLGLYASCMMNQLPRWLDRVHQILYSWITYSVMAEA